MSQYINHVLEEFGLSSNLHPTLTLELHFACFSHLFSQARSPPGPSLYSSLSFYLRIHRYLTRVSRLETRRSSYWSGSLGAIVALA